MAQTLWSGWGPCSPHPGPPSAGGHCLCPKSNAPGPRPFPGSLQPAAVYSGYKGTAFWMTQKGPSSSGIPCRLGEASCVQLHETPAPPPSLTVRFAPWGPAGATLHLTVCFAEAPRSGRNHPCSGYNACGGSLNSVSWWEFLNGEIHVSSRKI